MNRERDLRTALKAAMEAGVSIVRIEIRQAGGVVLVTGKPPIEDLELDEAITRLMNERANQDARALIRAKGRRRRA